ncbi:tryptophanase [Aeropyrum pernix K1]|uniref:Probable tryptophanase n=1 Tax=Aeropyrum pernix (strain ATCC 700893 / DSM 11879 / JCM 9820 / NBRC 100138 / K1) TaxID=272557 RepID=TNAA_AERPE|nr:tryptophanase [Aeropyrum pernix]Q9YCI2.1 RecName: Full=Probable tryptophanase; AltName: Full=L-tryptophan indole-lyase; Short=TNase [Aeropyrum pernix K1]BAA80265.1 tryptophanase [Aeropyrum pernix K1]
MPILPSPNPPVEPYKIRMVEPIRLLPREERLRRLREAGWNVFRLRSIDIFIDLLTDSGTGSMSIYQWAALMTGDEAYAGARSWFRFRDAVRDVLGLDLVLPVHQGRAAERILYGELLRRRNARIVPANTHFDTGRAVILNQGGVPLDLPSPQASRREAYPFKGDIDVARLERLLKERSRDVAFILLVITNNTAGGQPVSMDNVKTVRELADAYGLPLVMDICRFAENAYLVKERDPRYRGWSVRDIAREMISYGDHFVMSAKKDGLANIGGFIATRDPSLYEDLAARVVLEEGYVTYGGLAGRDLEAIAQGLREVVEEDYLRHRVEQVRYLGELLSSQGVPIVEPVGGHAVYVDVLEALPEMPRSHYPADALAAALYLESGVRAVGLGALAFAREENGEIVYPEFELLRLAVPRRTYTNSHMEYVAASLARLLREGRRKVKGLRVVKEPRIKGIRHFLAELEPIEPV